MRNLSDGFGSCRNIAKPLTRFFDVGEVNGGNLSQNNGNICKPFGVIGKFRKFVCKRSNAFCRIAHFFERLQRFGKLSEYGCRAAQGQIRQLLDRLGNGFYAFCVGLRVVALCEFCIEVGQLLDKFIYGRGCGVGSPLDGEFNPRQGYIRHRYPPLFLPLIPHALFFLFAPSDVFGEEVIRLFAERVWLARLHAAKQGRGTAQRLIDIGRLYVSHAVLLTQPYLVRFSVRSVSAHIPVPKLLIGHAI